jgi:hypothetical protein
MNTRYCLIALCVLAFHLKAPAAIVYTAVNGFPHKFGDIHQPYTYVQDLDLDADGAHDYYFGGGGAAFVLVPNGENRMLSARVALPDLERNIVALEAGAVIGAVNAIGEWTGHADAANDFDKGESILYSIFTAGVISNVPMEMETFLALELHKDDGVHYGWLSFITGLSSTNFVYIYGWAYESEPSKAILAGAIPEPSAGLLFLIAWIGLLNRRRKDFL